jgi:SAM-dependent methyltransferase
MFSLPVLKFFEPNNKFFELINEYPDYLTFYDIGAGAGHVSRYLNDRKKKVVAIDIFTRDYSYFPTIKAFSEYYNYGDDCVLMFCRPCHSYFVEDTISRGIDCGVKQFIYVGLNKNVENDLGIYYDKAIKKATNVGKDNESFWTINFL